MVRYDSEFVIIGKYDGLAIVNISTGEIEYEIEDKRIGTITAMEK